MCSRCSTRNTWKPQMRLATTPSNRLIHGDERFSGAYLKCIVQHKMCTEEMATKSSTKSSISQRLFFIFKGKSNPCCARSYYHTRFQKIRFDETLALAADRVYLSISCTPPRPLLLVKYIVKIYQVYGIVKSHIVNTMTLYMYSSL